MRLDDYFVFLSPDEIRIKGSSIGIEHVLYHYLYRFESPEAVAAHFPALRVEQVYATITYFWHCQETVGQYVARWLRRQAGESGDHAQREIEVQAA